jgi:GNAT superfamily N-acetyltransferase
MSTQFHVTHDNLGYGEHNLTLSNFDNDNLARVTFDHIPQGHRGQSQIDITYIRSPYSGQGHAKALMQHMYDRYPKSFINWGMTIHPAATHLAKHFEDKYYNRTSYEQNDGEEDY